MYGPARLGLARGAGHNLNGHRWHYQYIQIDMILFYDLDNVKINHIVVDLFAKQHSPRLHQDGFLYVFDKESYLDFLS